MIPHFFSYQIHFKTLRLTDFILKACISAIGNLTPAEHHGRGGPLPVKPKTYLANSLLLQRTLEAGRELGYGEIDNSHPDQPIGEPECSIPNM